MIAIAQHYPKLETLVINFSKITYLSVLALSERGLPLKELDIVPLPSIPTADIARRCSHALSCIRHLTTDNFLRNGQDASILIPCMTGLTSVYINYNWNFYVQLLSQHCHKLTTVEADRNYYSTGDISDTALIELIHACPQLHTLCILYETDITDIGILALSEHCPQLQMLRINECYKVTETAVLQILQRCRKLTTLEVSSSSLSEETWTQLDSNTQMRVRRQE